MPASYRRGSRVAPRVSSRAGDVALFAYSFLGFLYFSAGASVYLVEILAFIACAHIVIAAHTGDGRARIGDLYGSRAPKVLLGTLLVWLLATVLSDLVNSSPMMDAVRGFARVLSIAVLLVALMYFVRARPERVLLMWWGLASGQLVGLVVQPGSYFAGEPWKFGFSIPLTVIAFLLASSVLKRFDLAIAFGMAITNFLLETRSLAVVCVLAGLALLVRRRRAPGSSPIRLAVVFGLSVGGSLALVSLFEKLALAGYFGDSARARASTQSQGEFGALLTGRAETGFSLRSIAEHPLVGVGSYGSPSREVIEAQVQLLADTGYATVARQALEGQWSSFHSELFGSAAENGVLALGFWAVVAALFARGLYRVLSGQAVLPPLVAFVSAMGIWDLLYSPLGADRKFWVAASIVTVLTLCRSAETSHDRTTNGV